MRKKIYGSYRVDRCPFCGKQATTKSKQGVPVCINHKENNLPDLKCICGDYLDLREGKYGCYFTCFRCGNVSWSKAQSYNSEVFSRLEKGELPKPKNKEPKKKKKTGIPLKQKPKKEITVTSDELDFMF